MEDDNADDRHLIASKESIIYNVMFMFSDFKQLEYRYVEYPWEVS